MPDIHCENQEATERVAAQLAVRARAGDIFALTGDLGAGKSTFARAFIRAAQGDPSAEVPSPTFTLVQSYGAEPPIHHTDLYRLSDPEEFFDLGLEDERDEAVFLVEWPDRLPSDWLSQAIEIRFIRIGEVTQAGDEQRRLEFAGDKARVAELLKGIR